MYNPEEAFFIDSYWKYASGRDIYLVSKEEVEEYYSSEIEKMKDEMNKYKRYAL